MTAALIAEALAAAERETPVFVGRGHGRTVLVDDEQTYLRGDFADAALRHLAERVAKAEAALDRVVRGFWRAEAEKVLSLELYSLPGLENGPAYFAAHRLRRGERGYQGISARRYNEMLPSLRQERLARSRAPIASIKKSIAEDDAAKAAPRG